MDALTLILSLALVAGALVLILYPLWQQSRPEAIFRVSRSGQTLEEYQARYQAILAAIKDLKFDYEMGKVSAEDYETLLSKTRLEAAAIRQQIDRVGRDPAAGIDPALDAEIESLIARTRQEASREDQPLWREVEAEIELLKRVDPGLVGAEEATCPQCGKTLRGSDLFCSGCGRPVADLRAAGPKPSTAACPKCGAAAQPGDAFCVRCGAALNQSAPAHRYEDARV